MQIMDAYAVNVTSNPTKEWPMTLMSLPINSAGDLGFHSLSSLAATDCWVRYLSFVIELADKF